MQQLCEVRARSPGGWAEVARCHGGGAGVVHTMQRLGQSRHHAGSVQHVGGATGQGAGLVTLQHIGPARLASRLPTMAPSANAAKPAAFTRVSTGRASSRSTAVASVFIAMSSSPTVPPTSVNAAVSAYGVPAPNRQANAVACNGSVTRINRRGAMKRTS